MNAGTANARMFRLLNFMVCSSNQGAKGPRNGPGGVSAVWGKYLGFFINLSNYRRKYRGLAVNLEIPVRTICDFSEVFLMRLRSAASELLGDDECHFEALIAIETRIAPRFVAAT